MRVILFVCTFMMVSVLSGCSESKQEPAAKPVPVVYVEAEGGGASLLIVTLFLLVPLLVFFGSLKLIKDLWAMVLDAFTKAPPQKAKMLIDLVGGLSTEGKSELTTGGKIRIVGIGLLGTLIILLLAVAIVWIVFGSRIVLR